MSKTLVLAEKPSVGRDLTRALPGQFAKHEGYLESDSHVVNSTTAVTAEVTNELKELRRLFEEQSSRWQELALHSAENVRLSAAVPAPAPSHATHPPASEEPAASNPVVNSVMAQFAKLQKDVAQRKKRR